MGAVAVSRDDRGVVTLLLRNEPRRNALDDAMLATLAQVMDSVGGNGPPTRLLVLRGAGGTFCAGRDVSELADASDVSDPIAAVGRLARAVRDCPVPTVAAVEGKAVGLGVALASWCDLAIADADATFSIPEARIGVPPSITAVSLMRAIGRRNAAALVLTGRPASAQEAAALGLVQRVCPPGTLDEAVATLCAEIVRGSPTALRETKALLREAEPVPFGPGIDQACGLARRSMSSPDQVEGIAAFRERRAPVWA